MTRSTSQASMADVLKCLRAGAADCPGRLKIIEEKIINDLKDEKRREKYVEDGIIESLRDISMSDEPNVCCTALQALNIVCCDSSARLKLLKPPGFLLKLVQFLSVTKQSTTEGRRAVMHIHEQAADLVRKLVLIPDCISDVASFDVIQHMIDICALYFHNSQHRTCCLVPCQFPPQATSYLHQLSYSKTLVGKVSQFSPNVAKTIVKESKPEIQEMLSVSSPGFSILSIDLFDTTTDKDVKISEEIIKEGLAWPQFLSPDEQSAVFVQPKVKEDIWADILVTSVVDGGHFWAQVGGEVVHEKLREIKVTLQREDQAKLTRPPKNGDFVCVKTMVGGHQDLYRGKVLQVLPTDQDIVVEVFALDYGYKSVVPLDCLQVLTTSLQNVPFQAQFCSLTGIQAPRTSPCVVKYAAGALRNLAYDNSACRLQIAEKGGTEALLKLCVVPDKGVCMQAVGAILNLSISFKTRARIGYLGGMRILLDIVQKYLYQDVDLVCLALDALRNLMLDHAVNRGRVADADGFLTLTHVYLTGNEKVKQHCLGTLKNMIGNAWYLLTGSHGVDLRSVVDKNTKHFSLAVAAERPFRQPTEQRRCFRMRPGEVEPKPVERSLGSHVIMTSHMTSEESNTEAVSQEEYYTDGDDTASGGEDGLLVPRTPVSPRDQETGASNAQVNVDCYYVQGEHAPFCDDELHELREIKCAQKMSSVVVGRAACAFLNAGNGGTVYLGITKSKVVCGVEIERKDRDRLRLGVDELLGEFKPPVRYDKYQVKFVPVAIGKSNARKSVELIPDLFVIEVVFHKSLDTIYTTNKRRCYFRCGSSNNEYTTQEMRKWVIRNQESFYNKQIQALRTELSDSKQMLSEPRGEMS